jgi:hypothetical protein
MVFGVNLDTSEILPARHPKFKFFKKHDDIIKNNIIIPCKISRKSFRTNFAGRRNPELLRR